MWKKFISGYLTFSRKDRQGVVFLVIVIAVVLCTPLLFPYLRKPVLKDQEISEKVDQLNSVMKDSFFPVNQETLSGRHSSPVVKRNSALFYFDPNTVSMHDWMRLGVSEKTAATILKYREKGGKFFSPEDLFKIYTLSREDAARLIPYVRIRKSETLTERMNYSYQAEKARPEFQKLFGKNPVPFDINQSDVNQWQSLPGIGNRLALRIVNFRDKLGGFVSIDQVGETRYLPDSTFQKIKNYLKLEAGNIRKLNINKSGFEELNAHPYINYNQANAIVQYRIQHGNFNELEDLKKIHLIDDSTFNKIREYLSLQ